jgi:tetratricopeptide (TPR) repeat protein
LVAILLVLGWSLAPTTKLRAQESFSPIESILNPLPRYDPFARPPSPPRFFPNEADRKIRDLLIEASLNREVSADLYIDFFAARDAELQKNHGSVTGLSAHVTDLVNNTIREHDRYVEAQRKALRAAVGEARQRLIRARLRDDPLTQADELLRQRAWSRLGGAVNRVLGSMDLLGILTGSYVSAGVESLVSQAVAAGDVDMPIEERRALVLYREHLRRYPGHSRNEEVKAAADDLERKKKRVILERELKRAEEAFGKNDPIRADFHCEVANLIAGSIVRVGRVCDQLGDRSRWDVAATISSPGSPDENPAIREMFYALTSRDPEAVEAAAERFERGGGADRRARESASDARAVAREMQGRREEARKILSDLAGSAEDVHQRGRAQAWLAGSRYNLRGSFEEARRARRRETVRYVILGEDLLKRSVVYGSGPLVAGGPAGVTAVAAANALMIGGNLFRALTANPISHDQVIEKGAAYVRSRPDPASAAEVYAVLARAYEDGGRYDKAIVYYELAGGTNEGKISDLKEKTAQRMLDIANKSSDRGSTQYALLSIIKSYPETRAANEAGQKLARLAQDEKRGLRVSKKFLQENPELYGPHGLGLKSSLFDENLSNMELAEEGVNIINDRELTVYFKTAWGVQSRTYVTDRATLDRFQVELRKKHYQVAALDIDTRPQGSAGGLKNLPLPGAPTLAKAGEARDAAGDLALIRRAEDGGPPEPQVLNSKLMSEAESKADAPWTLPQIQGSLSASRFDLSGSLPTGLRGQKLSLGADDKSPFASVQLPVPLLEGFVPIDFILQGRPDRLSLFPRIPTTAPDPSQDQRLYR